MMYSYIAAASATIIFSLLLPCVGSSNSFQRAVLDIHNEYRDRHDVYPLKWDWELADHAQGWANRCQFRHRTDRRSCKNHAGENISYGYSSVTAAIKDWYEHEIDNYDFYRGTSRNGREVRHFTQMVWKDTTRVVCAESYCNNLGGYFYVCNYYPPGNYDGDFVKNVNPSYYNDEDEEEEYDDEST